MRTDILFGNLEIENIIGELPENTKGVTDKSGEVEKGYCFFAVKGEKADGREYIPEAIANGAEIIVSEGVINCLPEGVCNISVKDIKIAMDEICGKLQPRLPASSLSLLRKRLFPRRLR